MPKVNIEFDLPDEVNELMLALEGNTLFCALWDVDQHLRNKMKYEDLDNKVYEEFDKLREMIHDLVDFNRYE